MILSSDFAVDHWWFCWVFSLCCPPKRLILNSSVMESFLRCGKSELFSVAPAEIFSLGVMFNSSVSSLSTKSLTFQ